MQKQVLVEGGGCAGVTTGERTGMVLHVKATDIFFPYSSYLF